MSQRSNASNQLRIIFMGTPEFAVPSLEILISNGYQVVAVITAPDKPAGRGMLMQQSAVKKFALEHQLNILQPSNLKDPLFVEELKNLTPDLQIVVAFRMLPDVVWQLPRIGTFNLHGSLLPQYRGAAPINWAIMNGEKETGVTTFFLHHEIDTGNIILQEKMLIDEKETAGSLHDRMKVTGAQLVLKTVQTLLTGTYPLIKQQENKELKRAPKIYTEDCNIQWNRQTVSIYNQIRGLSPYPAAFTYLAGKNLKIFSAEKVIMAHSIKPGEIETDGKTFLHFAACDGFIAALDVQLQGKKKMSIQEFLRGNRLL
jgi:methionyl-tRNA formyltransferase